MTRREEREARLARKGARRRGGTAWFILASGLTFAVAAGLAASLIEPRYDAKSVVEFVEAAQAQAAAGRLDADGPVQAAWRRLEGAIENPSTLAEGGGVGSYEALETTVSGARLEITVRAEDPQIARRVADEAALAVRDAGGGVRALTVAGEGRRVASPVPAAAVFAGFLGLVVGALCVMLSRFVARRLERLSSPKPRTRLQPAAPRAAPTRERIAAARVPQPAKPVSAAPQAPQAPQAPDVETMPMAAPERVTLAELAAVLRSTPVSRLLVAEVVERTGADGGAARLARMLASEGAPVLLVSRRSAAGPAAEGITTAAPEEYPDAASLSAARAAFEHVIVDGTDRSADEIVVLTDEECAVVLICGDAPEAAIAGRMRELGDAGLESVILVRD